MASIQLDSKGDVVMPHPRISAEEAERLAKEIYSRSIRDQVETEDNIGKVLVIDVETGDYEMDTDEIAATHRALAKHPGAALWALRIGYDAMHALGGALTRTKQ
jgi:phosphomannomutase